jgi:hypothetical protein
MNWYLVIKFLHIVAVTLTIGGMFARQLVRAYAKKSDDVKVIASLTRAAVRLDRVMVIPLTTIFTRFVPYNKKVEALLQTALAEGRITPELSAALDDKLNRQAHHIEEVVVLTVAALMVLKPF